MTGWPGLSRPGPGQAVPALVRSFRPGAGHWASIDAPPGPDFREEGRFLNNAREEAASRAIYACAVQAHAMVSPDPGCEGQPTIGLLGYLDLASNGSSVPLHRCRVAANNDHFISLDVGCEGQESEGVLGFVTPVASPPPPAPPSDPTGS